MPAKFDIYRVLGLTRQVIREDGGEYRPSRHGTSSTKYRVLALIDRGEQPSDTDAARAREDVEFFVHREHYSAAKENFLAELQGRVMAGYLLAESGKGFLRKDIGRVVYAAVAAEREQDRAKKRAVRQESWDKENAKKARLSEYQGDLGERIERKVIVTFAKRRFTNYGEGTIVTMEDMMGNVYTWFASRIVEVIAQGNEGIKGTELTITGTVKSHEDFRGIPTTYLTRCKLVGELDEGASDTGSAAEWRLQKDPLYAG